MIEHPWILYEVPERPHPTCPPPPTQALKNMEKEGLLEWYKNLVLTRDRMWANYLLSERSRLWFMEKLPAWTSGLQLVSSEGDSIRYKHCADLRWTDINHTCYDATSLWKLRLNYAFCPAASHFLGYQLGGSREVPSVVMWANEGGRAPLLTEVLCPSHRSATCNWCGQVFDVEDLSMPSWRGKRCPSCTQHSLAKAVPTKMGKDHLLRLAKRRIV